MIYTKIPLILQCDNIAYASKCDLSILFDICKII